jgi:WD40 repeat protein
MGCVRSLAFSPDGKVLAAGFGDYALGLWDVAAGKKLHEIPGTQSVTYSGYNDGGVQCVVFSRDGKRLVLARDNQLALIGVPSGEEVVPSQAHRGAVRRVFFSPDGKRLLTTNDEPARRVLEWDATSGRLVRQVTGKATWPRLVSFSPDRKIMASTWNNASLTLWDTTTDKEVRQFPIPLQPSESPGDIAFSPDGKLLAVEDGRGKAVWLYDAATGKQVGTVEGMGSLNPEGRVLVLAYSLDSRALAAAADNTIHLAELPSGRQLLRIALPKDRHSSIVAVSPDGRTLAAPCHGFPADPTITMWEAATGKARLVLPGPRSQVTNVAFSPDGRLLAAGGWDHIVFVWDTVAGKQVARLEGHKGNVESLAFSPDGRRLASGSEDTTALVWDVTGLTAKRPHPAPLSPKDLESLWSTLASADAAKAYQAVLTLESSPEQAVPFLAERLRRRPAPDAERLARLVARLDSEDFAERQRAGDELRKMGWEAEPALSKALEGKPSLEVRKRAQELLDDIRKAELPSALVRLLRATEVLERVGTSGAKQALREAAQSVPQTRVGREAAASLLRLSTRTGPGR